MKKIFFPLFILLLISCESSKFYENGMDSFNNNELAQARKFFERVEKDDKKYQEAIQMIQKIDSITEVNKEIARVESLEKRKKHLTEMLDIYLKDEIFKTTRKNYNEISDIKTQISYFDEIIRNAKEAKTFSDPELEKKADLLLKRMPEIQKNNFPILRQNYASIMSKKLWRENIEVKATGSGYTTITVIGGVFASNANVEDFNNEVWKTYNDLRFKKAAYKWIPNASNYTQYSVKSKNDSDID